MPVMIKNINITNLGPLNSFTVEPGMLNLIYGKNEMGKTHLVEFLIHSLFRNPKLWPSRTIKGNGKITLKGIEKNLVAFSPRSKKKIEDYLEKEQIGLPTDFSRLLVIRGAETGLKERNDKEYQGVVVSKSILKKFLSSQELLTHIGQGISQTIKKAKITDTYISGDKKGELKRKEGLSRKLKEINQLIIQVDNIYSGGYRLTLDSRKKQLIKERDLLIKAKRHLAYTISQDINELENQKSRISEEKLQEARELLSVYRQKIEEYKNKKREKEKAESLSKHYDWLSSACDIYEKLLIHENKKPSILFLILSLIALISSGICAYLKLFTGVIVSLPFVLLFGLLYVRKVNLFAKHRSENKEIKKIETGFNTKFKEEMTGLSTLREKLNSLEEHYSKAKILQDQLFSDLRTIEGKKIKLKELITELTGESTPPEKWTEILQDLAEKRNRLDKKIKAKNNELNIYGVKSIDYVKNKPDIEFDQERLESIEQEIENIEKDLNQENQKLEDLKRSIYRITDEDVVHNWESLIQNLKEKKKNTIDEYKQITAEIVGKAIVHRVLEKFQKDEDTKIIEGLKSSEVMKPLHKITQRYTGLELNGEELIVSDSFNDFSFSELSTGAQEQILLSLRIGFSRKLLNKDSLFMILDDAFQYSDWERRKFLIDQMIELTKLGWQILYLTMDDHIKSLFNEKGKQLENDYKFFNLHKK